MSDVSPAASTSTPTSTPSVSSPSSTTSSTPSTNRTPSSAAARQQSTPAQTTTREYMNSIRNRQSQADSPSIPNASASTDTSLPSDLPDASESAEFEAQTSDNQSEERATPEGYEWLDSYKEGVHGVPVQELLQSLANGEIPDALMNQLKVKLRDGDQEWMGTLEEARNGAMMKSNYFRKTQELADQRKAFQGEQDELVGYLNAWKSDPVQLVYGLRRLGMPFEDAARHLAQELDTADQLNAARPGAGDQWLEAQRIRAEHADMQRQQELQQQQQKQQQAQHQEKRVVDAIRKVAVDDFKAIGLKMSQGAWKAFSDNVTAIWNDQGRPPTRQEVRDAAVATKELVDMYAAEHSQSVRSAPQTSQQKLGQRGLDGGAPKNVNPAAPKKVVQTTTSDFLKKIRGNPFQGR